LQCTLCVGDWGQRKSHVSCRTAVSIGWTGGAQADVGQLKVGVASRQELVARVFLDEYLPEVAQSTPLTSRGGFDSV